MRSTTPVGARVLVELGDKQPRHLGAELLDRLAHRGERRLGRPRQLAVVEAHHGHVVGHPAAGRPQRVEGAEGHEVGRREQAVDGGLAGEQRLGRPPARRRG